MNPWALGLIVYVVMLAVIFGGLWAAAEVMIVVRTRRMRKAIRDDTAKIVPTPPVLFDQDQPWRWRARYRTVTKTNWLGDVLEAGPWSEWEEAPK